MLEDDVSFYERRAREEAEAAATSSQPALASAHRLLAIEYAAQAEMLRTGAAPTPQTEAA